MLVALGNRPILSHAFEVWLLVGWKLVRTTALDGGYPPLRHPAWIQPRLVMELLSSGLLGLRGHDCVFRGRPTDWGPLLSEQLECSANTC